MPVLTEEKNGETVSPLVISKWRKKSAPGGLWRGYNCFTGHCGPCGVTNGLGTGEIQAQTQRSHLCSFPSSEMSSPNYYWPGTKNIPLVTDDHLLEETAG